MTLLTQSSPHNLKRHVALAAIITNIGVGHGIGNGFTAVIERRQFPRAKGATTGEVDANRQT